MRITEKVTRNVGILRRELTGKGSRSLVESVVEEAALHQESTSKIWKVKAKEFYWGREHWEKVMLEPIGGKLLEYRRGEYVIFEAPAHLVEDYIRRRILLDYEILEEHECPHYLLSSPQEVKFPFEKVAGARVCGDLLKRWLMDSGLSLLDAEDIIVGIPDFKSTSIALSDKGKIVDYDQYYPEVEYVVSSWHGAIRDRLLKMWEKGIYATKVVYFRNVAPECLEFYTEKSIYW